MNCPMRFLLVSFLLFAVADGRARAANTDKPALRWKAGAAAVDITPEGSVWMAGYAARKKPSEGVSQKLFAKALALDDGSGGRLVIVTLDLIGVPRIVRETVERRAREQH